MRSNLRNNDKTYLQFNITDMSSFNFQKRSIENYRVDIIRNELDGVLDESGDGLCIKIDHPVEMAMRYESLMKISKRMGVLVFRGGHVYSSLVYNL